MSANDEYVKSPCIGLCTLDEAQVCIGCLRHVSEIRGWRALSPDGKRALLAELAKRRTALEAAKTPSAVA